MSEPLPPLRRVLDIMPSPDTSRPGLLIRDPMRYTESMLYVPPAWILGLQCLDGEHTELDVQEILTRARGTLVYGEEVRQFIGVLREHGFLESEEFHRLREEKQRIFREGRERLAVHAGAAYPNTAAEVRQTFENYFGAVEVSEGPPAGVCGVAAPHVSPEGGRNCYAATYRRLGAVPALAARTFVVLGTSHWGMPGKFGLTRKPFVTPLGTLQVDTDFVDLLEHHGGEAVSSDDYCHVIEHSIEFQCLFLQYVFGAELTIVPILCGPLLPCRENGSARQQDQATEQFFRALGDLAEKRRDQLFWVLGIDLTHIGRRYGDPFTAIANRGQMLDVAEQDRRRLDLVCAGDSQGFLDLVGEEGDELKWCGYSTLYTFMRAVGQVRGRVLRYEQWNIDPQSVVSFASLEFCAVVPVSTPARRGS